MKLLMEYYDENSLKNIVAILGTTPDKVVFFYDAKETKHSEVYSTFHTCRKYIPHLKFEVVTIDCHDYNMIEEKIDRYISDNQGDDIMIDLTGGSELLSIMGYKASKDKGVEMLYSDILKNSIINLYNNQEKYRTFPFELNDVIEAKNGLIIGYTSEKYLLKEKEHLYALSLKLLNNVSRWSKTCTYFQKNSVENRANSIYHFEGRMSNNYPDKELMYEFQKHQLIKHLTFNNHMIRFEYQDTKSMDFLASYGLWLELFTYYSMMDIKEFHDVKTSIKIDWNRLDATTIIGNEIDVTAMYRSCPIIISCKLSENATNADALNELFVVSHRIGEKYAIPVLVTHSDVKAKRMGIYMKAKEMGILIMDRSDILSESFAEKLKKGIKRFFMSS